MVTTQEKGHEESSLPDTSINTPVFNSTANEFNDVLIDSLEEIKDVFGCGDNSLLGNSRNFNDSKNGNNQSEMMMDEIVGTILRK